MVLTERSAARLALAMSSLDKVLGWFPHTTTAVAVLLWLLMVVAISELELSSIIPI